jgi:ankyrin repeat protein
MSSLEEFADAIENGDSSVVESLISSGVDVNARLPRPSEPPALVAAAVCGKADLVDILLRANARIDDADENGWTACHFASYSGNDDVLALLLARQPNLAAVDGDGKTSFEVALVYCRDGGEGCALMLAEAGASFESVGRNALCWFASMSTVAARMLINHGVVVREIVSTTGKTPLHHAAGSTGDATVFDLLVNVCGIDLDARSQFGVTSIHEAANLENAIALRWLIEAGADVNVADQTGTTPLHQASDFNCAVLLLAAGANVCARDNRGRTALHRVAFAGMHALLAAGADLNASNDAGETGRQLMASRGWAIEPDLVEQARRDIAKARLGFVRCRALQVCIGLQSLELDALQTCEILQFACLGDRVAPLIPFHIWWKIATTVKHFRTN